MSIFDWSKTALTNGTADPTINWAEGQPPSTVNDSARSMMARLAYFRDWLAGAMTQGGASNAYTITSGESLSAYASGMRFLWKPNANSTGAVTLNVDGRGAKKVYMPSGSQAGSGDISVNAYYDVVYVPTLDSGNGGFKIVGAPDATNTALFLQKSSNLSDLTNAGTARTNLGVSGNLYNVTASAFALTLLDDANAGAARATLELGTAALKNTGASGDAVPLLNVANTFSAMQTIDVAGTGSRLQIGPSFNGGTPVNAGDSEIDVTAWTGKPGLRTSRHNVNSWLMGVESDGRLNLTQNGSAAFQVSGNTIWHAGNDGAGSGLDADTVDGLQGSDLVQISGSQTITGAKNFTGGLSSGGAAVATLTGAETLTNKTLTSPVINGGTSSARPQASSETTGTLTAASANKTIQATGNITIDNSVFSAGDIILVYAGASSRTITPGIGVTMHLDATSTTGARTLAAQGVAMLYFVSASQVIVCGAGVT
ncbi:hypothetical protein [Acidiphilium sp.]|uniref:hypothetical protein n=1 Tax=Acidiphilium sp. TaxID=527 RepID=UPI0025911E4B|nr:hypothetical protein [Acidiphilium sp.]